MDPQPPPSNEGPGGERASGEASDRNGDGVELRALEVGGGAAAGAVLGRLIGGGPKGTLIGAVVGAAAGTALTLGSRRTRPRHRRPAAGVSDTEAAPDPDRGTPASDRATPAPDGALPASRHAARKRSRERLDRWTKARLYEAAKELEIPGRSKMNKAELIRALQRHPGFTAA